MAVGGVVVGLFLVVSVLACKLVVFDIKKSTLNNYLGPNNISCCLDPVPAVAAMVVVGEKSVVKHIPDRGNTVQMVCARIALFKHFTFSSFTLGVPHFYL